MKFLNRQERSGKKSRENSKVQRDMRELVERQCSQNFASDAISGQKRNPLQDFFIDEINLTRKLLNIVQTDINASSFEDDGEVRQIVFSLIFNCSFFSLCTYI